ncbi:PA14 domain-containing protein [Spirosoma areae]
MAFLLFSVSLSAVADDKTNPRKPERRQSTLPLPPVHKTPVRPFDADPIRFILRADKPTAAIGEEITLTVSAHYLNIPSALLFSTAGSTAFRLKLLLPDGFVQTGGENLEYVGTELSATKPTLTYTLKGYFTKAGNTTEFRLLRSHATADANSLFVEKARLSIRLTPAENSTQQHQKGARSAAITNGVGFLDEADCNSVRGWAADQAQPNVAVDVDFFVDGQYAGSTQANQSRPDVGAYLGDNGNHGFVFPMPQSFRSGGNHSVEARFSGSSQGLNSGPKTYACSGSSSTPSTTPTPSSGGCSYSEGQFLLNFNGELIYAHYYNGVLFAAYQNASEGFKPQHWMQAAGFDPAKVPCFAATDPRLGSTPSTPATNPASGSNNGSGLLGSYYNNTNLSGNPVRQQVDAMVNFTWGDQGPSPAAGANATNLSVRWSGQVEAPVSGTYKFKTFNDDATRLTVNGQQLINDWPGGHGPTWFEGSINLTAGQKYSISLEFNQGYGGAQSQLHWEYPGQGSQLIPQSRLYPDGASSVPTSNPSPNPTTGNCGYAEGQFLLNFNGELIYAHYYNGVLFAAYQNAAEGFKPQHWMQAAGYDASKVPCFAATDPRLGTTTNPTTNPTPAGGCGNGLGLTGFYTNSPNLSEAPVFIQDAAINFSWANDSPAPGIVDTDFSVLWVGQVEAPISGNYIFKTNNDDGTRLRVNGQLIINDWNGHGPTWQQGSVYLNGGQKYDIQVEFVDFGGGAQAQLYWEYAGQGLQIVPACRLYPTALVSTQTPNGRQSAGRCFGTVREYILGDYKFLTCNGEVISYTKYEGNGIYSGGPSVPPSSPANDFVKSISPVSRKSGGSSTASGGSSGTQMTTRDQINYAVELQEFYVSMQQRGISFSSGEKALLKQYPDLFDQIRTYIDQFGSKPDLTFLTLDVNTASEDQIKEAIRKMNFNGGEITSGELILLGLGTLSMDAYHDNLEKYYDDAKKATLRTIAHYGYSQSMENGVSVANAFKHAFFQIMHCRSFGRQVGAQLAREHEENHHNLDNEMDYWNNERGLAIYDAVPNSTDQQFDDAVFFGVRDGQMRYLKEGRSSTRLTPTNQ